MKKNQMPDNIYDDGRYLAENDSWHTEDSPYKASFVINTIEKNNIKFKNCADIGCGAGLVTEILARKYGYAEFTGFELSKDAQKFHLERRQLSNLRFSAGSLQNEDKIFDLIICLDVFEHIEDYFGFLRGLKGNGKAFIFNIPLDMNALKILTSGIKFVREEVGHIHYFSEYSAIETLKDCGYRIISSEISMAYLLVPPRNFRQLLVLPIRILFAAFGKKFATKIIGGTSLVVYAV